MADSDRACEVTIQHSVAGHGGDERSEEADVSEVTCVLDAKAELGECPVWSAQERALYWVDIRAPALHRLDFDTGELSPLALIPFHVTGTRFNDGKVSPDGRFFAGTMDEDQLSRPVAALYRLDPDASMHQVVDGLIVSNGLAWSADGRTMFHSDSKAQVVWTYDYDPGSGAVSNRRELAHPTEEQGRPDGGAADEKGHYWSAGISAGVLNRWAPDGTLDRSIPLPCARPTAPCFGGSDLRTIFVTSLRHDLPDDVLAERPLSGGIFAVRVDVPGVPIARFRG